MKPELIRIFADESRISKARYMLQGGIWIRDKDLDEFEYECGAMRANHNIFGHMKWTKVSTAKYEAYCDMVDVFLKFMAQGKMAFRCIVIDTLSIDHAAFNKGDNELGFYKFYYQLLIHGIKPAFNYHITLAHREDKRKSRLSTLKHVLNNTLKRDHGIDFEPVRAIESPLAKEVNAVQLADILMGAVGYQLHDLHLREGAKQAKAELAAHIARQLRKPNLKFKSLPSERGFNIWHIRLKDKRRPSS